MLKRKVVKVPLMADVKTTMGLYAPPSVSLTRWVNKNMLRMVRTDLTNSEAWPLSPKTTWAINLMIMPDQIHMKDIIISVIISCAIPAIFRSGWFRFDNPLFFSSKRVQFDELYVASVNSIDYIEKNVIWRLVGVRGKMAKLHSSKNCCYHRKVSSFSVSKMRIWSHFYHYNCNRCMNLPFKNLWKQPSKIHNS